MDKRIPTILVVDDMQDGLMVLSNILRAKGYRVFEASDGVQALEVARKERLDLIVSDILMPNMDGFAMCRALKQDPRLAAIPLVFYTATFSDDADRRLALDMGAERFLVKPMEIELLCREISAVLSGGEGTPSANASDSQRFKAAYEERLSHKLEKKVKELERERAALMESESRFRQLAENIRGVFWLADFAARRMIYVSPRFEQLWGIGCDELYRDFSAWLRPVHPDDRHIVHRCKDTPEAHCMIDGQYRIRRRNGDIRWIHDRGWAVSGDPGRRVAGIAEDVTEQVLAAHALRETEERLRNAQVIAGIGIWERELEDESMRWSEQMKRLHGVAADAPALAYADYLAAVYPADRDRLGQAIEQQIADGEALSIEYRWRHPDGRLRHFFAVSYPKHAPDGRTLGLSGLLQDVTESRENTERIRASRERLRKLTNRLEAAREEERAFMAREIHDELGQRLTGLKLDLAWLLDNQEHERDAVEAHKRRVLQSLDSTLQTVRRLGSRLRPAVLDDLGLADALEAYAREFQQRSGCELITRIELDGVNSDRRRDIAVFRILQESLTNIARHAGAELVEINVRRGDNSLTLDILDDGCGIDARKLALSDGSGIAGMQERAEALGGRLDALARESGGAHIHLELPMPVR